MPELPEVETIRRRLANILPGKKIAKFQVLKAKSFIGQASALFGATIVTISRRAKILRIKLKTDSDSANLLIHLKMTGQLIYLDSTGKKVGGGHPTADWINQLPSKHTRIIFNFTDHSKLFFNDQRIFGWIKLMTDREVENEWQKYGPDINTPHLTAKYLSTSWQRKKIPVKLALMDNQIVTGIGNIYASEALYAAKINPQRPAKSLTMAEVKNLLAKTQAIINHSIELGGTTFDGSFVNIHGFAGQYQKQLKVYQQDGRLCPVCGTKIKKVKLAGRSTFYCDTCQK